MNSDQRGTTLIRLAREAINAEFDTPLPPAPDFPWLNDSGASFVTLTHKGRLRGCIGSLVAHRPLLEDLRFNAVAAAFHDPRFNALQPSEWPNTSVEVSLLSPSQVMLFDGEQDALAQLRPGIDGVILEYRHHRSTFLPQVWDQLPTPERFMFELKQKAGLPGDFWAEDMKLSRYTVEKFI